MADCDSCGENTATPPVCEDCRAAEIVRLGDVVDGGWQLSNAQGAWLLAEVDRLRGTIARRGEEYDAVRAALEIEYGIAKEAAAERDRLFSRFKAVRDLVDNPEMAPYPRVAKKAVRAALDGEVPS